jgi:cAMP-dependent protein kinase regulator
LPKIVYKYSEGDYFGELALIHDVNRQASIKTLTPVRVAYICRDSFKRILGNLEDILKRNELKYTQDRQEICV